MYSALDDYWYVVARIDATAESPHAVNSELTIWNSVRVIAPKVCVKASGLWADGTISVIPPTCSPIQP